MSSNNQQLSIKVPLYVSWRLSLATWALRVYVRALNVSEDESEAVQDMFQRHGIALVRDKTYMERE